MTEYQIQPCTKRCTATGREFQPGEPFYTVLIEEQDHLVRQDFSQEAWKGPPPGAFSFWRGHVPRESEKSAIPIDDELLLDCFHRLEGQTEPQKVSFRYVIALLLLRRKRFRFEDVKHIDGNEVMFLRCSRAKKSYQVVNPQLTEAEIERVQEDVFRLLGWA